MHRDRTLTNIESGMSGNVAPSVTLAHVGLGVDCCRAAGAILADEPRMKKKQAETGRPVDNDHQKTVSGKNQNGPADKVGANAGGNEGSKGQNSRNRDLIRAAF